MIRIRPDLCTNCGICTDVCPFRIPVEVNENGLKQTQLNLERIGLCLDCGHCAALCPQDAIEVETLYQKAFDPVIKPEIDPIQLLTLLQQRRSIRNYQDKQIPRKIIDQIIDAARSAPTGTASSVTGIIIIDDPETLNVLSRQLYKLYNGLEKGLNHPIFREILRHNVKRYAGKDNLRVLEDFALPGIRWYIRWFKEGISDRFLRNSPAVMLFHNPIDEPVGSENCIISAFQAILMAEVLGIGTCFNDLIPMACNSPQAPEIRTLLGLPTDRAVFASLTMGFPKYTFERKIPKELADIRYL